MALNPTDWSKRVEIIGLTPSGTYSGFVGFLNGDNIPADVWSTALNGGGDLRICTDSEGVNQLPLEIPSGGFDTVAETANIWFRFDSYSAATRTIWLFYGKAGETQPLVTDTYGRNAVWADYRAVYHLGEAANNTSGGYTDSTGSYDATGSGMSLPNSGLLPNGMRPSVFDGNSNHIVMPSSVLASNNYDYVIQAWASPDNTNNDQRVISLRSSAGPISCVLWQDEGGTQEGWAGFINRGSSGSVSLGINDATSQTNRWDSLTFRVDSSSTASLYVNGSLIESASIGYVGTQGVSEAFIGRHTSTYMDGGIAEVRIRASLLNTERISDEYDNQNDPSSFWTVGTPESTGGTATEISGSFSLPVISTLGSISITLPQPVLIGNINLPLFDIVGSVNTSLPNPSINGSFTLPLATVSSILSATLPSPDLTASFSLPLLIVNANTSITLPQPNLVGSFSLPDILVSSSISTTLPQPYIQGSFEVPKVAINGLVSISLPNPEIAGTAVLPSLNILGAINNRLSGSYIDGIIRLPVLQITGATTVTLPKPEVIGAFVLPVLEVLSSVTIAGLIVIPQDSKTNINQVVLSSGIKQQILSSNINKENLNNNITYR